MREEIMQALFNVVRDCGHWKTASRRLQLWSNVPSADKPAVFVVKKGEVHPASTDGTGVRIEAEIFIYMDSTGQGVPDSMMNPFIDGIANALAPNQLTGLQTLGGLVQHCWIEGKIMQDSGDMDGDGVAVIPVKMLIN